MTLRQGYVLFSFASMLTLKVAAQEYTTYYKSAKRTHKISDEYFLVSGDLKSVDKSSFETVNNLSKSQSISLIKLKSKNIDSVLARAKKIHASKKSIFASPAILDNNGDLSAGITNRFVVRLKTKKDTSILKQLASQNAIASTTKDKLDQLTCHLEVSSVEINAMRLANLFHETGLFEFAEPNFLIFLKSTTNDPFFISQWALNNISNPGVDMRVTEAWTITKGIGIKVAVLDVGVELNHPDLVGNLLPGFDATGLGSGGAPNNAGLRHGTACAGIVSAKANNGIGVAGVAYNAKVIPVTIANKDGNPDSGDPWTITESGYIASGINWARENGADIITMSFAAVNANAIDVAISQAVTNGRDTKGCLLFAASSNENSEVKYPASNPNVVAVGATTNADLRASFSNFGLGLDVVAPGVDIYTTDLQGPGGYAQGDYAPNFGGTSAAAPNAAAVAALILSVNPNLTQTQARAILETTVDKIRSTGFNPYVYQSNVSGQPNGTWNNEVGYGRVNARAAVCAALGSLNLSISGPVAVCSSAQYSIANAPPEATFTWTSANTSGFQVTGQGTTSATFSRQNNFTGFVTITATINGACSISVQQTIWVGNPPADNNTLIWTGARGTNPVTLNTGSTNQYQCDFVPYADSYTWVLPRGFRAIGSTTTTSPFISIITTNQVGVYTLNCRANNGACFSWTRSLTINVVSSGGGGQQMRAAFPNPANDSFTINLKEEDSKGLAEVALFNKSMERVYFVRTEEKELTISTSTLLPGIYYLNIVIGKEITQHQIVINH